jgi:hypothetical protein
MMLIKLRNNAFKNQADLDVVVMSKCKNKVTVTAGFSVNILIKKR